MRTDTKTRAEDLAQKLLVAGEPTRLRILCILISYRNTCVSDIAEKLGLSVAIISHHLQALTKVGLLKPAREGKRMCYVISDDPITKDLKKLICKYKE